VKPKNPKYRRQSSSQEPAFYWDAAPALFLVSIDSKGSMGKAGHNAVYNARILNMPVSPSRYSRAICFYALLLMHASIVLASGWHSTEEQLARKVAAVTGPGAVSLDLVNRSSLSQADVEEIRRELTTELDTVGVRSVGADQAAAAVHITLSETLQNYVWVAEITQGNGEASVVMVAAPRSGAGLLEHTATPLTVHKTLLWTEDNRILDAALLNTNPQRMVVIDAESIVLLTFQDSRWRVEQSLPITHLHAWPRDLRGRLALRKDHLFDAYLPGVFCRSTTTAPLAMNCFESDDPWPLEINPSALSAFFAPARNFFTGALSPGIDKQTTVPAFYSAARIPRDKYNLWIFAAVDGQVHLVDGVTDQAAAKLGWGGDLASVRTGCGVGWQVLVTRNGDSASDTVTAFEIADREPAAMSQPAEFNGKITALWADSDETSAIAVDQNSQTGKYEAYRVSIICNQ
jgi:hypothetical protein